MYLCTLGVVFTVFVKKHFSQNLNATSACVTFESFCLVSAVPEININSIFKTTVNVLQAFYSFKIRVTCVTPSDVSCSGLPRMLSSQKEL